jgi:EpsI family protein
MKPFLRFLIIYLLFGITALYLFLHVDTAVPSNRPLADFPRTHATWTMTGQTEFSAGVLDVLRAADYLSRQYSDTAGSKVTLYLGYHSGGKGSGGIHSPKHCLPGSGWFEVSTRRGVLDLGREKLQVVRAVYQKDEQKELYLYWFQVKGRTLSDEYSLKLAEILNSFLYGRRDSAFIRISVPFETDEAKAVEAGERFARDFYPVVQEFLPR